MTLTALALTRTVKDRALELGFDRVAVGAAGPPDHAAAFERWLDAGYAGDMHYLDEGRAARLDPGRLLPGWRSVVAVALNYAPREDEPAWRGVARYARGRDYHRVMRPRLHALRDALGEAGGAGVRSRASVDTSAVLERSLAARAGLGWFGKSTNLIAPGLGSYFLIGLVLTTAELVPDGPVADRCGTCRACLDACPTSAFVAPYVLDARRCIAYLTIEHRGPIDEHLHAPIGDWLFGCDVCQEVCPWNRRAPPARDPAFASGVPPGPPEALLAMTDEEFRDRFRGSALKRARRSGLARNAAIVLANRAPASPRPDPTGVASARFQWYAPCSSQQEEGIAMVDRIDPKKDNKDAESGEPVQLDKEQQGGEQSKPQHPGQQQPGQARPAQPQPGPQQGGQQPGSGLKR